MQQKTEKILDNLDSIRRFCYQSVMDIIHEYIYREQRYEIHFSVAVIYTEEPLTVQTENLKKLLRKTDKLICVKENIVCVVFDAAQHSSYVKAAENLYKTLKELEYHQNYYIATALSDDFDENYLDMINTLFERLKYSVEHKLYSSVNYEDYII